MPLLTSFGFGGAGRETVPFLGALTSSKGKGFSLLLAVRRMGLELGWQIAAMALKGRLSALPKCGGEVCE